MYGSFLTFPNGVFAELDRLQHLLGVVGGQPGNIRAVAKGAFPAINVGNSSSSIEVYAFAPGLDPSKLDVQIDKGFLTISGERNVKVRENASQPEERNAYATERFTGRFKRVVSLPEDADPNKVEAKYEDGVLHISIARRESSQPKRIQVQ